ncbi:hypothetical protein BD408DRAFT_414514 [Parasitella parasitica]|nr:hypothetical protein BD408DRAFT_414514 [Parasitella parasitica]
MSSSKNKAPHYSVESSKSPTKGILQKSHDFEEHETPEHKLKWDEPKLKAAEKQQRGQVLMKINEPNTPYIRYDPVTDKVTNWEDLPENIRSAHEEPDEFALDDQDGGLSKTPKKAGIAFANESDEWQKIDEKEKRDREDAARKRHEEFEKKRAHHYYHAGDVLHEAFLDDKNENKTSN